MRGPFENGAFRRLFAGRVVTNVGDSFYFVAAMWLVYDLTGDPLYSGIAGFLTLAPSAFQFLAGPLVDRWSIRKTLTGTQAIQAVVVLAVPVAAYFDALSVWLIIAVMPALAALNQLVYPAQSAALPRLLDDEDLVAANSAFSVAYQGVDVVANALGGLLIAVVGGVALFALDAVTFGAAALLFATVAVPAAGASGTSGGSTDDGRDGDASPVEEGDPTGGPGTVAGATDGSPGDPDPATAADGGTDAVGDDTTAEGSGPGSDEAPPAGVPGEDGGTTGYLEQLREGAGFLRGTFLVWLVLGASVVNFAAGLTLAAMPAYADALGTGGLDEFLAGAGAYGVLMGAFGAGNLVGAVGANAVADRRFGRLLVVGFAASAVCWSAALVVDWLPGTAVLLALAFVPAGVVNVQLSAVVQSAVPEALVGRVSSVLGSASAAAVPVGSLAGGAVAGAFGARTALWASAAGFALLAAYVLATPSLRGLPVAERIELRPGDG